MRSWVIIRKPFYYFGSPWPWPLTSKSIGVICESWSIYPWSFMILGVCVLELSSRNHFTISGHCDLDLWPSDLKINRGHLQVMINVPMKFHDPSPKRSWVIIGNHLVDEPTDRPTDMCKAKYPLFFEGWHKYILAWTTENCTRIYSLQLGHVFIINRWAFIIW
jgi:hypothetical protein